MTINVSATQVWYVDNSYSGANGASDGTSLRPFTSLSSLSGAAGPDGVGDIIYVAEGTYTTGITLLDGQTLHGAGTALIVDGIMLAAAGTDPTISNASGNGVTLASNNILTGFTVGDTGNNFDIANGDRCSVGNLIINNVVLNGSGGLFRADSGSGTLNVNLESASTSGTTGHGIQLGGTTSGSFTVGGTGTITGVAGTDVLIGGSSSATINIASDITSSTGGSIEVTGHTGANGVTFSGDLNITGGTGISVHDNFGTSAISFTNADKDISTGIGNAISLVNNSGLTINFTGGGLDVDATSGAGITATGGGTINITGSGNTVNTGTGQVLNWNGVSVGGSGVTFGTLGSSGTVANTAISLNNVDGGTFSGGNVTVAGTTGGTSDGIRIDGGSAATFNFASATIDNTGDDGIDLNGANGAVTFTTVDIDGNTGSGLETTGNTNAININGGSIGATNDPSANAVDINAGTGNITIGATITKTTANDVVEVSGRTGGTVDFNGLITSSGSGGGIDLTTNTGGTIRFDGGISLSTGAATAFNATGGGTLIVTDPAGPTANVLTTTTATALNIDGMTIGGEGVTFQAINSSGGSAAGIMIQNTTGTGTISVTGTGTTANSGGTIASKTSGTNGDGATGTGIYLNNTSNISLANMQINDHGNFGVRGNNVTNLTLNNLDVNGSNGSEANGTTQEYAVNLTQVIGNVNILNTEVSGGFMGNVRLDNQSGTTNLNFLNNTIQNTNSAFTGDGFNLEAETTAVVLANVSNNVFTNNDGDDFNLSLINSAVVDLTFNNNDLNGAAGKLGAGVFILGASFNGTLEYDISNNNVQDSNQGGAIHVNKGSGTAVFSGQIVDNVIGTIGDPFSGSLQASGIIVGSRGAGGSHTTLIHSNEVYQYNDRGIIVEAGEGDAALTATITSNTVSDPASPGAAGNSLHGIHVDLGINAADNNQVTLDIRNNLIATAANEAAGGADLRVRAGSSVDVFIAGYSGGNSDPNAQAFFDTQNPAGTTFNVTSPGATATFNNGPASPLPGPNLPELPPAPLLASSSDGVEAAPTSDSAPPTDTTPPADTTPPQAGETDTGNQPPATTPETPAAQSVIVDDGVLTQAELDFFVDAAITRWTATGLTDEQVAALNAMEFSVASMDGIYLGTFTPGLITFDADAAGSGWFLDGTPLEDSEFGNVLSATRMRTDAAGAPAGHYDLLTTVMHEMGHVLGLGDSYASADADDLMFGYLYLGERRIAGAGDAAGATVGAITGEEFLAAPINIFDLRPGETVTVQWNATVNPQTNQLIQNPSNQGTVTSSNFAGTATNVSVTTVDSPDSWRCRLPRLACHPERHVRSG